jgi:hypothetical protein
MNTRNPRAEGCSESGCWHLGTHQRRKCHGDELTEVYHGPGNLGKETHWWITGSLTLFAHTRLRPLVDVRAQLFDDGRQLHHVRTQLVDVRNRCRLEGVIFLSHALHNPRGDRSESRTASEDAYTKRTALKAV